MEPTDRELIERFTRRREEAAFAMLVARHGPLVMGVCRRVLQDAHAAEDAFQAVFLVLARKAGAVRKAEALGSWLYGVACRVALKLKSRAGVQREKERQAAAMPQPGRNEADLLAAVVWHELRPVLDEELNQLPEKYRTPLVLCYLQGKTHEQAARELGWSRGSMSRRMEKARELLRSGLARRGVTLSAGMLFGVLSPGTASAAVSAELATATVKVALLAVAGKTIAGGVVSTQVSLLAEGVLHTMFLMKLKVAAVLILTVAFLGTGVGVATHQALAARQEKPGSPAKPASGTVGSAGQGTGVPQKPKTPQENFDEATRAFIKAFQVASAVAKDKPQMGDDLVLALSKALQATRPMTPRMIELSKEKREIARKVLEFIETEYKSGRGQAEDLPRWSERLLEAELEISVKREDRIIALQRHLEVVRQAEAIMKIRYETGRIPIKGYLALTYDRLQAEQWLEQAKAK